MERILRVAYPSQPKMCLGVREFIFGMCKKKRANRVRGKATIGDTLINRCGDSYAGRLRDEGRRRTPPFRCLLEKRVHILNFNCRNYMLQAKVIH